MEQLVVDRLQAAQFALRTAHTAQQALSSALQKVFSQFDGILLTLAGLSEKIPLQFRQIYSISLKQLDQRIRLARGRLVPRQFCEVQMQTEELVLPSFWDDCAQDLQKNDVATLPKVENKTSQEIDQTWHLKFTASKGASSGRSGQKLPTRSFEGQSEKTTKTRESKLHQLLIQREKAFASKLG